MLININTKKVISEQELFAEHPSISFPAVLTDDVLFRFGYANVHYPQSPDIGRFEKVIEDGFEIFDGRWTLKLSVVCLNEQETQDVVRQIKTELTGRIQARLDRFAQDHGYDNIISLCTYATSSVERFRREGQRGVDLRDQTWAVAAQIMDDVAMGKRPLPMSFEEIASEFPALAM